MIIAIPLDENRADVCPVFGRAPFYLFHNTENDTTEILENPAAQAEGGAGIKAAQFIVDSNADTLVTPRCGENSAEVLKLAEIAIYKSEGNDAMANLASMKDGKLQPLTRFHAGYHGIH